MAPDPAAHVLVYDRIAQNRRKTVLLVVLAALSVVPFIGAVSYGVADFFIAHYSASRNTRAKYQELESRRRTSFNQKIKALEEGGEENAADIIAVEQAEERRELEELDSAFARDMAERSRVRGEIMIVATALTVALGMVFWAISSSPTSKVLAMCAARPAGDSEAECRRLLDNLSIGAGLPPPKLYVIESSQPNAFAAGVDPEHSVVVVTRALLGLLDTRELEGVLAHELSHIGNRDTRLNTYVSAIALFLRLPYLLRRRARQSGSMSWGPTRRFNVYLRVALTPIYLYIFFIAPVLAAIIRAAISRSREFLADADAALLTRYPEGLIRALAKIRGAGSEVQTANPVVSHLYFADPTTAGFSSGLFGSNLFGSHPPIDKRILRLAEFNSGVSASAIEAALRAGQEYSKTRPAPVEEKNQAHMAQDELSVLMAGNPIGRVFRVVDAPEPIPVYDQDNVKSGTWSWVRSGDLLVAFDDPSKMRQVLTGDQCFGYIPRTVKLVHVDMLPAELTPRNFRAKPQTAPDSAAAPMPAPAPVMPASPVPAAPPLSSPSPMAAFVSNDASAGALAMQAPAGASGFGLSGKQLVIAGGLFVVVFAGISIVLFAVAGK